MPVPRTKLNGATANTKPSGTTTAAVFNKKKEQSESVTPSLAGKPDRNAYDAEQDRLKSEIDALQVKLSAVKDKISLATKPTSANEKRNALRAELDSIHAQHQDFKSSRQKKFSQLKSIQEGIQKKIKDLQAAKSKVPFKTVDEVDEHIRNLDMQINSGKMKLADEKRALQEIQKAKRQRRTVENFQSEQEAIEADRATADRLREQLDDPDSKALSERYEGIKYDLETLKKESEQAYGDRTKLFEERDSILAGLNDLFSKKREAMQLFRDQNERFRAKINEDRARRAERARQQRAAEEAQKKQEIAQRIREEAEIPAFQTQIEDCQTLIDYFSGKSMSSDAAAPASRSELAGVPKLEIRQVDGPPEGSEVRRKKNDEEVYFVGGKGKGKGKRTGASAKQVTDPNGATATALPSLPGNGSQLNVPFSTLRALMTLSIPVPTSSADVPRLVEDLKTKKAWFEANQARTTAENIAKAEGNIQRLMQEASGLAASQDAAANLDGHGTEDVGSADPDADPMAAGTPPISYSDEWSLEKAEVTAPEGKSGTSQ